MNFVEIVTKLFGNKSQKDMKAIRPYVEQINAIYPSMQKLSNDELRERTEVIKAKIADKVKGQKDEIARLKASIEELPIEKRESVYRKVDDLEKDVKKLYEEVTKRAAQLKEDAKKKNEEVSKQYDTTEDEDE